MPDRDEALEEGERDAPGTAPVFREKATFSKNCGRCRKAHGERACRIQTIKRKG